MPNTNGPNITSITPPRVAMIDERTGAVSREWYRFFYNLFYATGGTNTGAIPTDRGGTGTTQVPLDGQILIGNTATAAYNVALPTAGNGIGIVTGPGTLEIDNTGVTSIQPGAGISVDQSTGDVTVSNTGVLSFSGGSTGLTPASATAGEVTLGGTLDVDNGGTGQTSYTDGQLLIGNSTGNTLTKATLTAGSGVTITNGAGSITIAASGGTAAQADKVKTVATSTNADFYITFVDSNNSPAAYESVYTDAGITYNPSTNSITSGIGGGTF